MYTFVYLHTGNETPEQYTTIQQHQIVYTKKP